ncbi:CLUMA_CG009275, isoform A [Clunio marinus]|uniref:CLUMA_CG009275, isoform A n=1 Tax=Clunio marinus TaxID=568069 RepID=A0A1J1I675_9DIPT|nr:CLUMA_CG009275, isoform A [Clunio marinus]
MILKVGVGILLCLGYISAWPKGSRRLKNQPCIAMWPRHRNFLPQNTTSPFTIKVSTPKIRQGEVLTVFIEDPSGKNMLKGFTLEAKDLKPSNFTVGSFLKAPDVKVVECKWNSSAVTQNSSKPRKRVELKWKAPSDLLGNIQF